jgi:DNA-directed RNA polymerase subunit L
MKKKTSKAKRVVKDDDVVKYETDDMEEIDLTETPELNIKYGTKSDNEEESFSIILSGKSIDRSIANALRRTIMSSIPIYGFHRSNMFIDNTKTNCMLNNHMLYTRFEMLPILDCVETPIIVNPLIYLNNKTLKETYMDLFPSNVEDNDEKEKLANILVVLDKKNNTNENICLSSHDVKLEINGKPAKNYLNNDKISLFYLRPGESVYMSATANLGIEDMHAIYEVTSNAISLKVSEHEYNIKYDQIGNMNKKEIFKKACIILQKKCNSLLDFIENNKDVLTEKNVFVLMGEDYTLGYLLSTALQRCGRTKTAAAKKPHYSSNFVQVEFIENDNEDRIDILIDCAKYLVKIYKMIESKFNKLN